MPKRTTTHKAKLLSVVLLSQHDEMLKYPDRFPLKGGKRFFALESIHKLKRVEDRLFQGAIMGKADLQLTSGEEQ